MADNKQTDWVNLKKWTELEIAAMREQNDNDLDEKETAVLRGRIQFAKEVLARGHQDNKVNVSSQHYID